MPIYQYRLHRSTKKFLIPVRLDCQSDFAWIITSSDISESYKFIFLLKMPSTFPTRRNIHLLMKNICIYVFKYIFKRYMCVCAENRDDIVAIDRSSLESLFPLSIFLSLLRSSRHRLNKTHTHI